MKAKHVTLLLIAAVGITFLFTGHSFAFRKDKIELPEKYKLFPANVAKMLINYKSEENTKFTVQFDKFWSTTDLPDKQRDEIMDVTGMIGDKNLAPSPFLVAYLSSVMVLLDSTSKVTGYDAWTKGVKRMLKMKNPDNDIYLNILNGAKQLEQSKIIFKNEYITWLVDSAKYCYEYDTTLYLKFQKTKLISYCYRDTARIYNTSGVSYPLWNKFKGSSGVINWHKSGYDSTKVYATVSHYNFSYKKIAQQLDSVQFFYTDILKKPVKGSLKLSYNDTYNPEQTYYPQFESYNKNISITNLFDSLNFNGGLSIKGRIFIGYGTQQEPATVTIIKAKKPFIIAKSPTFQINSDGLTSANALVVIRMVKDSIVHYNKILTYGNKKRELRLTTDSKNILTKAPFLDSYHQIGIMSDQLYWNLNSDMILFNAQFGSTQADAIFESFNFFNQDMFDNLMRHDDQHPVFRIRDYERQQRGKGPLTCDGFSRFIKRPNSETENLLKEMAFLGYIIYDSETRIFRTTIKMRDAIQARNARRDYDPILFVSQNQKDKSNAQLDLNTFNLSINGISQINLSDSQNVKVYPRNNTVIIKHNRDMEFDGEVRAGLTTFSGNGFKFNYDFFTIDFENVVSMSFDFKTEGIDNTGQALLASLTSKIENITGTLSIDSPNNKSGLTHNPTYPKFKSNKDCFIYYDDPAIFGGIYKRDKFYFRVYPFEIDSLNSFAKEDLKFRGELTSAGIFEPIEQTIKVQPDKSLGFVQRFDTTGAPVYAGKGRFFNKLKLSNEGLIGSGALMYMTTTSKSPYYYYFPDSCVAIVSSVNIERSIDSPEFPNGYSKSHPMRWEPYKDVMDFERADNPFILYDNQANLIGDMRLQPTGLTAKGKVDVSTSTIASNDFRFKAYDFAGNSSSINIFDDERKNVVFNAEGVRSDIDLKSHTGLVSSNGTPFQGLYPQINFAAFAPKVRWTMNDQNLAFESRDTVSLPPSVASTIKLKYENRQPAGAVMVSTRKDQDSLCFATPSVLYEVRKKALTAQKVEQMLLGDALLKLNTSRDTVILRHGALIDPIHKAEIFANRNSKNLYFFNVDINVGGRNGFIGAGNYTYIDKYEKKDTIHFDNITLDKEYKTIAYANIMEEDKFFLSPRFKFKGKVTAHSTQKNLVFDGGAQMVHDYKSLPRNWLRFTQEIDPKFVTIPVNNPYQTIDKVTVYAGSFLRRDSVSIYPTFFTGRKYVEDSALVQANGYLYFNDVGNYFQVSEMDKVLNPKMAGNMISLYNDVDILVNEGKINLGVKLGEATLGAAGRAVQNIGDKEFKFNGLLTLDFLFSKEALNVAATEITAAAPKGIDYQKGDVQAALRELLGNKMSEQVLKSMGKPNNTDKIPDEYKHTITFNDIQLKWDRKSKSYVSVGELGVANINDNQVNKKVKGFIELAPYSDHRMYVFLDLGAGKFYLFAYTAAGNMFAASSNDEYYKIIDKIKTKNRSIKHSFWESAYIYTWADERIINIIKARYQQLQKGEQPKK